ncbi:hypothetical protein TRVL_04553 [Trypanosoma vivax]|nr:hypothetical protein TRVL_04553 [Trypanosoma vivax]
MLCIVPNAPWCMSPAQVHRSIRLSPGAFSEASLREVPPCAPSSRRSGARGSCWCSTAHLACLHLPVPVGMWCLRGLERLEREVRACAFVVRSHAPAVCVGDVEGLERRLWLDCHLRRQERVRSGTQARGVAPSAILSGVPRRTMVPFRLSFYLRTAHPEACACDTRENRRCRLVKDTEEAGKSAFVLRTVSERPAAPKATRRGVCDALVCTMRTD